MCVCACVAPISTNQPHPLVPFSISRTSRLYTLRVLPRARRNSLKPLAPTLFHPPPSPSLRAYSVYYIHYVNEVHSELFGCFDTVVAGHRAAYIRGVGLLIALYVYPSIIRQSKPVKAPAAERAVIQLRGALSPPRWQTKIKQKICLIPFCNYIPLPKLRASSWLCVCVARRRCYYLHQHKHSSEGFHFSPAPPKWSCACAVYITHVLFVILLREIIKVNIIYNNIYLLIHAMRIVAPNIFLRKYKKKKKC